jgi:hypothetical protein
MSLPASASNSTRPEAGWFATTHWSVVLLAGQAAPMGRVIESILMIWLASEPGEWVNRVAWLPL